MISIVLSLLVPWITGYAALQRLLGERPGSKLFSWGLGYFLAVLLVSWSMRLLDALGIAFTFEYLIIFHILLMMSLLTVLRPRLIAKAWSLHHDDYSPLQWLILVMIVSVLVIRFSILSLEIIEKPLFPWDGWFSWSAKAKIFYQERAIVDLYWERTPWWEFDAVSAHAIGGERHMNMLPLIQSYVALAYGQWQDSYINIPWLLCGLASVMVIWGGLRYAGFSVVEAAVAAYLFSSLPIVNIHLSLGSYADIWVGCGFLITALGYALAKQQDESALLLVSFLGLAVMFSSKSTALWTLPAFLLLWLQSVCSTRWLMAMIALALVTLYLLAGHYVQFLFGWLDSVLGLTYSEVTLTSMNNLVSDSVTYFLIYDNWHFMFLAGIVSSFFLFTKVRQVRVNSVAADLLSLGWFAVLVFIYMVHFSSRVPSEEYYGLANRLMLHIAPVLCTFPVLVHHILSQQPEVYRDQ